MATKRIIDLTQTATEKDLASGSFGLLDLPNITKKIPGYLISGLKTNWYKLTPTTSVSNGFRINSSGAVESASGYVLNRYNVSGLNGRMIKFSADYYAVFSTTDSASQRITPGITSGEFVVPSGANFLIVSHTADSEFSVSLLDVEPDAYSGVNVRRLTQYNSSSGFRIDDLGSVVSDADYDLARYHMDDYIGRVVNIDTLGNSVFSTTDSASGKITNALPSGSYVVPEGGLYLIISVKKNSPYGVYLAQSIPSQQNIPIYGIQMRWSENTTYRLESAADKVFSINETTGQVTSDFDSCYPWSEMKVCNIENPNGLRNITYQGESGFSYSKDTYVEVPKFYFKRHFDPVTEYEYWYVSSQGGDGFELEPWFKNSDGSEASVRYVARYNLADNGNISRTGYAALANVSKNDLKSYCEANDVKLMDIYAYQALMHLFVIESGTKDSQAFFPGVSYFRYFTEHSGQQMLNSSATTNTIQISTSDVRNTYFGVGDRVAIFQSGSDNYNDAMIRNITALEYGVDTISITFDGSAIALTQGVSRIYGTSQLNGKTDSIATASGRVTGGDKHTRSFSYRGIENLWGNLGELMDGISYDYTNRRFKIGNTYVSFETPLNRTYIEETSYSRWIKYFGVDARFKCLILPSSITQSDATSYKDEWSTFGNESGISDVSYGCAWDHQNANGVMCFRNVRDIGNILYTGRAML